MNHNNALMGYQNYQKTQIVTATQKELVLMLYQGMINFLGKASDNIRNKEFEEAHKNLIKTKRIITELISTINFDAGQIAKDLHSLYFYLFQRVVDANIKKDSVYIEDSLKIINILKQGWEKSCPDKKEGICVNNNENSVKAGLTQFTG